MGIAGQARNDVLIVAESAFETTSFGRGSTSFALSKQAMPAFILYSFYCTDRTCEDNSNEVEPRPNKGHDIITHNLFLDKMSIE
jgi:hypothetical protein